MTKKKITRKRIGREEGKSSPQQVKLTYKKTTIKKLKRRRQSGSISLSTLGTAIVAVIIVVVAIFIIATPSNPGDGNGNGEQYAISYSVTTIHEEIISLPTYEGKKLFFYFTGSSCIPCQMQLPYIVDAYNYYKSTGQIEVISLDIQGNTINELLIWEQANGITWKVCQDSGLTLATYFSIAVMPTLIIVDENGHETNRYIGANDNQTIWDIFQSVIS